MATFTELGLSETLLDALQHLGYENPTPIQEEAIPGLLEGQDIIGQAQTGTGKTAAFGLPLLQYIDVERPRGPGARPHPDARAVHPGDAGAARVRREEGREGGGRVRRRADPHPAGAAEGGRAGRGRNGGPRDGPDEPPLADAHVGALRGARRGRRDARPRLPRGRRDDPLALSVRPPDRSVQRHDADRDQEARREGHVRPARRSRCAPRP